MPDDSLLTPGYWVVAFAVDSKRLRQLLGRDLYNLVISTIPDDGTLWDDRRWVYAIRAIREAYASGKTEPHDLVNAAVNASVPQAAVA
jgi:hypothetical protein